MTTPAHMTEYVPTLIGGIPTEIATHRVPPHRHEPGAPSHCCTCRGCPASCEGVTLGSGGPDHTGGQ